MDEKVEKTGTLRDMWEKISGLQIHRRKSFLILLAVELLLILLAVAGLFGKNAVYEYDVDMAETAGAYDPETGICAADPQAGQQGDLAVFRNIAIPAGTYEVRLHYETDADAVNMCSVSD
ncbi:MAG: hypothetical protein K2K19_00645, partial [Acetatifactor sp.]|nr:hypothetical protein [Acetatifactor sp.]